MNPSHGSGAPQPSAPPVSLSTPTNTSLSNSSTSKPVGFSSLMSQSGPYPGGASQTPYPGAPTSQPPYPGAPTSQLPYPGAPTSQPPYPGGASGAPMYPNLHPSLQNPGNYSAYSLPNVGQQPPPSQGNNPYQQNPYQSFNPTGGYPGNQQPRPQTAGGANYQNPYGPQNPYQSQQNNMSNQNPYQQPNPYQQSNPYGPPQGNYNYQNTYPQQPNNFPPQQPYNPQQSQGMQGMGAPYNQPQQPYINPYGPQSAAGGFNTNSYGSPAMNDRLRTIAGRYEINDTLAQRLAMLQQFEIVVLCDDSGSMNTPVDGTTGTRWDELRSIVQIVIEIGTVFDSNGVDVHFLNRQPMLNVTDARQVVESFSQRPSGLTPLTSALRRIFQSAASKPGSDKRLLVFVATDGAPTDSSGNVDIQSLENLMRHERQANTTYVTFLACTDDEGSVSYLSQWDRTMQNVDVVDDYKSEREEVRRIRGHNYPFSFGDYVAKALLGSVDQQIDSLDESGINANNFNNNFRRF